ncbi:MAG: cobaltochelatase subunit CobN, partial [Pseudomonadota bacterium]
MHVVFRESHGLEETETPIDLGQSPADLIALSFSDSDLGALAAGWHRASGALPTLRLANIAALRHPLSVDTYIEQTAAHARGILVRLIGGASYWPYGLQQLEWLARREGIALAVLPADGRPDPRLDAASTVPHSTLRRLATLCEAGGAVAAQAALAQLALAAGLYAGPVRGVKGLSEVGAWTPEEGVACPAAFALAVEPTRPRVLLTFYRSYLSAADLEPIEALAKALEGEGFDVLALYAPSLKAPDAAPWIERWVQALRPAAIVNATAFSGRGAEGRPSPLDAAGVPVFQIALSTADRAAWAASERGLSPADLAMHVVLPEVDGRLFAGVASFKQAGARDGALEFSRYAHRAEAERITAIAARVSAWVGLASKPAREKRLALVLSSYPGRDYRAAHAIGLDALASAKAMLADLAEAGYMVNPGDDLAPALKHERATWPLAEYRKALARLPEPLRTALARDRGAPEDDPCCHEGTFHFRALSRGNAVVALQPERGAKRTKHDDYHDLSHTPAHAYVAFYLWLAAQGLDALVHIGAHGTLEWLPGKSVALSEACWPEALTGALPVVYPFIVNDPGEAAQAKRRLGALTLGHIPPPMRESGTPERLTRLEGLLDEFSNADGLDPARRTRLIGDIRSEAEGVGLAADLGLRADLCPAEAIQRIDRFVCDLKESRFGDGLHIFARVSGAEGAEAAPSAEAERTGLLAALAGKRVAPGPSGSPWRGRLDVLPSGRNLFTTDPRAVPSRAAHAQGVRLAQELVRRHLQDEGEPPRAIVIDLWGSATMRTAGEELAMALELIGVRPLWDATSERVSGIEVVPLTERVHPRIDVTLRVSGLFRDVFPTQMALFSQAVTALAHRDEPPEWNPYAGRAPEARVYGPAAGRYGLAIDEGDLSPEARARAGEAWLAASAHAYDSGEARPDPSGIEARVAAADAFVHLQDLPETDLLAAADYAAQEGGFAAAKARLGGKVALYHLDARDPEAPRARALREEIARVVRARAANPAWVAGMMRHGFQGGAEIAATLDHLAAFAHLAGVVEAHLFDLYHEATLGRADVCAFL